MEQSLKEIQYVFLFYVIGFFVFLLILYPAVVFFNIKKYKFPSLTLINLALVSLASAIGSFAFCKILNVFFFFSSHFIISNSTDIFNPKLGKELGFLVSLFTSVISPFLFLEETKRPKHNQKEVVEVSNDTPLSEIKKIVSEKFPNTDLDEIEINFGNKDHALYFFPYHNNYYNNEFKECEDCFEKTIYPYRSLGHIIRVAKLKDPTLKKTKVRFLLNRPHITVKK